MVGKWCLFFQFLYIKMQKVRCQLTQHNSAITMFHSVDLKYGCSFGTKLFVPFNSELEVTQRNTIILQIWSSYFLHLLQLIKNKWCKTNCASRKTQIQIHTETCQAETKLLLHKHIFPSYWLFLHNQWIQLHETTDMSHKCHFPNQTTFVTSSLLQSVIGAKSVTWQ